MLFGAYYNELYQERRCFDNGKMATIALIVIMLISQKNPDIPPIVNSSLRFLETAVGVGIGIAIAWLIEVIRGKKDIQ